MNYAIYTVSMLLCLYPLWYILYKREFATYFVYFIANASFIVLNLIGSISPHIIRIYTSPGFYLILLLTSLLMFILFFFIQKSFSKKYTFFKKSKVSNDISLILNKNRRFIILSGSFSLLCMLLFAFFVSPPFFLIKSSLEKTVTKSITSQYVHAVAVKIEPSTNNSTELSSKSTPITSSPPVKSTDTSSLPPKPVPATSSRVSFHTKISPASMNLLESRISIVASRPFHWFALVAFELPLFLSILTLSCAFLSSSGGVSAQTQRKWYYYALAISMSSLIASFWILSKQYAMYLFAGLSLVIWIFQNRISIKSVLLFSTCTITTLFLLYFMYSGENPTIIYSIFPILFHRIFEVYPWTSAIVYNLFPQTYAYLDGRSMINFFHLFNYEPVSLANLVYEKLYHIKGGSAPVPALFENYANWGWLGIVIGEFIIMLTVFVISVLSWSKDIYLKAFSIYLSIKLILLWQAPFWYGTFEATLVLFYVCLLIIYWICYYRTITINDSQSKKIFT